MCGKFTQMSSWKEVHDFSTPVTVYSGKEELVVATPMRFALVMRLDANGQRELVPMRWGFADARAANPARPKHMHVRGETIDTRPTFASAFARSRGILMVHTFNEGEELPNGKTKQWVITPADNEPIAIAVIYEEWRNGDENLLTFIQVTTPANALISRITDRMPAILPRNAWATWLGETAASPAEVKAVLQTFEDDGAWSLTEQPVARKPKKPVPDPNPDLF